MLFGNCLFFILNRICIITGHLSYHLERNDRVQIFGQPTEMSGILICCLNPVFLKSVIVDENQRH